MQRQESVKPSEVDDEGWQLISLKENDCSENGDEGDSNDDEGDDETEERMQFPPLWGKKHPSHYFLDGRFNFGRR